MATRWTALTVMAALAGAAAAWLGLAGGSSPAAGTQAVATGTASASAAAARASQPEAGVDAQPPQHSGRPTASAIQPTGTPAASENPAATPDQRAAAQALLLASFNAERPLTGTQPAPVNLRRSHRLAGAAADVEHVRVSDADTGLRGFPGAEALPGQSYRSANAVSATSQAFASFNAVRSHFAAQLQPSADGVRQLTVLADNEQVFDARVVDLSRKTIQRAQLAAGDSFVVVHLSRVDVR